MSSLGESFSKLIDSTFTRINGVLVEKTNTGYKYQGKDFTSVEAVKAQLQQSFENLNNSINQKQ